MPVERQAIKRTIMKKLFTLLIALGLITVADAQRNNHGNRGNNRGRGTVGVNVNISGNNGIHQSRFASDRMLREQIFRINQKYDHKIRHVQNDHHMRRYEKMRKIRRLEDQRQREINRVYSNARFNNNRYGNRHSKKNRRY